ncbi:Sporulation-specific protein 5 [Psilocybe cubensis]|uniref:Sporulation-specific protein 5 n=2 Tax=Psilocybe cubensis TaxID=181762 RepID=A0ACB8GQ13_PSICU|nr:Sporulation-specific protein 5 [Psilocybe cubensis]KAH9477570.1 Sporulation-specific protein 5 [Psilocybe cubensis]
MPLPSTPPAVPDSENIRRPSALPNGGATGGPAKLGAPSFASVVSSSSGPRATARSPKASISPLQHKQKQEHAHSSAPLPSKLINNANPTSTLSIASTNGHDVDSPALTSSSRYHSPMTSPAGSKGNGGNNDNSTTSSDTRTTDPTNTGIPSTDLPERKDGGAETAVETHRLNDSAPCMNDLVNNGNMPSDANSNQLKPPSRGQCENGISNGFQTTAMSEMSALEREQRHQHEMEALTSSMHLGLRVSNSMDNVSAKTLSPLPLSVPLSTSPSQLKQNGQPQSQAPSAPVHSTIPLPDIEDGDRTADVDARQLQHLAQHQQMRDRANESEPYAGSIDLTNLTVPPTVQQRSVSLGLPSSQSENFLSTFDATSPGGSSPSSSTFPTSASDPTLGNAGQKTPNVYINGLPPHFPEDQLFALASPYGEIRSVRTFTRHVRDSESGYGFVLFETVEAAERCIVSLRSYRNLHPTFSKQIHKIPGTTYAHGSLPSSSSWEGPGLRSGTNSSEGSSTGALSADASFKAKMESLQDPTSTNLYMEGLPLSIDEPTLAALVAPHRISSSRFFQTRLSNPPRIIAFVRLETREGAEEIIERLHGRMVRGWNDTGSRISVRFADTSEQRELRRTERAAQEGDGSPARLTIAQAALLNLRGQELRSTNSGPVIHAQSRPPVGRIPSATRQGIPTSVSAPDFATNAHLPPVIGSSSNLEVDYSLAPGRGGHGVQNLRSISPYDAQFAAQPQLGHVQPSMPSSLDPTMSALLDSLGRNTVPYQDVSGGYNNYSTDANYVHDQRGLQHQQHPMVASQSMDNLQHYSRPGPVYTRSGYTPTEEYIMRAHAESAALASQAQQQQHMQAERRRPAPLDLGRQRVGDEVHDDDGANIAVGVRGYRTQASIGRLGQGMLSPPASAPSLPSLGMTNEMTEDEFHASASATRNDYRSHARSYGNDNVDQDEDQFGINSPSSAMNTKHNPNIHPAHVNARLSREPVSAPANYPVQRPPIPLSPSLVSPSSNQDSSSLNDLLNYQHAAAHMRSTTLPQHRTSSLRDRQQRGHFQHNSMSMPAQNLRTPQHASVATLSGTRGIDGATTSSTIFEGEVQDHQQSNNASKPQYPNSPMFDLDTASSSPSLISPTLTYSSQTPSTLSPATPFFGSFNNQAEGGDKGHAMDHYQQKKMTPPSNMTPSSLRSLTGSR